ncbi:hypothetical protein AGABI1DRAFT_95810, partial [Agaricus bisporus var. burnettii JB137-S8]
MESNSANTTTKRKSACICVCGCNRKVSYPTRRAHVAAKRALDETYEDQRVNKQRRSKLPTDQSEEWQEDGRFGAASPEPPQIEDTDFLYQDPPSSLSPRAIRVAEKTRQIITNRWRNPPSQPTPDVQEDACDDDYENEEEDLEWIQGEDGNSVHASDNISDDERESEGEGEGEIRRRLNYRHTAKMAQATDLPIELIDLIFSFLPPNHTEQVQWRRAAAAIGREPRPEGWNLSDHRCRRCGRVCLAMWDYEEQKAWVIQRWGYWGPRQWAIAGFFVLCPCDAMIGNYFGGVG